MPLNQLRTANPTSHVTYNSLVQLELYIVFTARMLLFPVVHWRGQRSGVVNKVAVSGTALF